MSKQFKAGDIVTPNACEFDTKSFTRGKPYKVRKYQPAQDGMCGVLHFESDDKGHEGRFRPASYYESYVEPTPGDFRIRKRGTVNGEIRGTRYTSQEEARKAAERYVDGVYEVVRVVVERVIEVKTETRVTELKEAA